MKYDESLKRVNSALRAYAKVMVEDSPHKNKWSKGALDLFISNFVRDEISEGRIQAEINLKKQLETEYNFT